MANLAMGLGIENFEIEIEYWLIVSVVIQIKSDFDLDQKPLLCG